MGAPHDLNQAAVPEGFRPFVYAGPSYFQTLGTLHARDLPDGLIVLGLRLTAAHCNRLGIPHGGMLATLADGALGINLHRARRNSPTMVTVNLSLDYLAAAREGEWLEAHVTPRRLGRQLAFGDCVLRVGEREVLRATGIFAAVARVRPSFESDG
ncbi:MAG: PaaI family thioesterase [Hydrogenophaga sp.]|nr:PaaI family thioesterase [Hydrogenophaga sp.]